MSQDKWNLKSAIACVTRNGGTVKNDTVTHPQPGLKVLGAMDYLKSVCKYTQSFEKEKPKKQKEVHTDKDDQPRVVVIKKRKPKAKEDI